MHDFLLESFTISIPSGLMRWKCSALTDEFTKSCAVASRGKRPALLSEDVKWSFETIQSSEDADSFASDLSHVITEEMEAIGMQQVAFRDSNYAKEPSKRRKKGPKRGWMYGSSRGKSAYSRPREIACPKL